MKLSVAIITFNEEKNIGRCLASLQGIADEIVVIDSFSTDKTEEICKQFGCVFIQKKWAGYSAQKNYANSLTTGDYILSIDADEALSDVLKNSLRDFKINPHADAAAFNRLANYCGNWIYHCGWYPDKKLRIWKNGIIEWQGAIHEQPVFRETAQIAHLNGDLLHYTYYTIDEHYRQADRFASIGAQSLFIKGKKINRWFALAKAFAKFVRNYIVKRGFLDGKHGFTICKISAIETWWKYSRLIQLNKNKP